MHVEASIVVPVFNGATTIVSTVEHLLNQSLSPKEIIVVDDGSTDDTIEVLKPFETRINYQFKPNGGPASARNFGARLATAEFIAFTDSDCLPDRNWLKNLLAGFDSPNVAGVGGSVKSVNDSLIGEYVDLLQMLEPAKNSNGEIEYLITANACFRREALLAAELFDERFRKPGGEEPALCRRMKELGHQFRSAPQAVVLHHHRQTVGSFLRTIRNYGEGRYLLGKLWPDYQIADPTRTFFRQAVAIRSLASGFPAYVRQHGVKKALAFSALDYLRQLAFLRGYLRGVSTKTGKEHTS